MAKWSNVHKVQGVKRQRSGAFRDWRSRLGGGWRLDDEFGTNRAALPKSTKPKVNKVSRLIKKAEFNATMAKREVNTAAIKARLSAGTIEKY